MATRTYITIDGDDVGRKITACYIENDDVKLRELSNVMSEAVIKIAKLLEMYGFTIIFSAADGVAGFVEGKRADFISIHKSIQQSAPVGFTFSAGVGESMRDAYMALLYAKSSGKNVIVSLNSVQVSELHR